MKLSSCFFMLCTFVCATEITAQRTPKPDLTVRSGDVQLKKFPAGTRFYKSRPLYPKQSKMTKYMMHRVRVNDWSGQYFALSQSVTYLYAKDYLTGEKGGVYLKTYELKNDFEVLLIKNKQFADGYYNQHIKADKLKGFFKEHGLGYIQDNGNIPDSQLTTISLDLKYYFKNLNVPLVSTLNNLGFALECPHDNKNNEIILPPNMKWENILREVQSKVLVYGLHPVADPDAFQEFDNIDAVVPPYKKLIDEQKRIIDAERQDSADIIVY
ncbi:uncharacterized protein LOC116337845 [Contarinia nasturtii]|uniref:uncharacterized protein LOC116337845 n=1 Tax=Contarinia nasturtii TaxID=265458 RepID=UPI0012D4A86A|nr:uncharacterized protein LOC116337845 [Contarinia nasturtii]